MIKLFKSAPSGLRILFVSTEVAPFVKVGGLGSVMEALPRALRAIGYDARVMIPRYLSINQPEMPIKMEFEGLKVPTGNESSPEHLICNVKSYMPPEDAEHAVPVYFLENQEYYEQRANVYGYADDPVRWALLSRGALEFIRNQKKWVPQVIVSTDWMTGFLPNYLKREYRKDPVLSKIASVFSIHNLSYQGMFDHNFVQEMDFDDGHSPIPSFDNPRIMKINGMRRGIMYADAINTVSPTYAKEITTKEYGESLEELLRERRSVLFGILNGIDYRIWNPETDPYITHHYSANRLGNRISNKKVLQEQFGLKVDDRAFVVGVVARIVKQKGLDLLFPIIEVLLKELRMQLVVVGEGDPEIMRFFHDLAVNQPSQVAVHLKFDSILPHQVFAGADAVVIPSRFEASGLTQMEAMRCGAIPIVRKTGGLADTVDDYNPENQTGTGFVFERFDAFSLMMAIVRAVENYHHLENWRQLQMRAMKKDFSWESSARKYGELFRKAVEIRARSNGQ